MFSHLGYVGLWVTRATSVIDDCINKLKIRGKFDIYMFEGTLLNLITEANSVVPDQTDPKWASRPGFMLFCNTG